MRAKINKELAAVAEEVREGALTWCRRDVERLITPYPPRPHVDKIIANLGEGAYLDEDEKGDDGEDAQAAVADTSESSGDEGVDLDVPAGPVAPDDVSMLLEDDGEAAQAAVAEVGETSAVSVALSAEQADQIHAIQINMSALQESIAALRAVGHLAAMQGLEIELAKERRRQRVLVQTCPAVAASFLQRRDAEEQETRRRKRLADDLNKREVHAAKVKAELERANEELKKAEEGNSGIRKFSGGKACDEDIHSRIAWRGERERGRCPRQEKTLGGARPHGAPRGGSFRQSKK